MGRNRVLISILASVAILLVAFAVYLWRTGDTSTYYEYETYADIKKDASVRAATVPEFVPSSATQLVGEYNVEFNTQELEFAFAPADGDAMTRGFQKAAAGDAPSVAAELSGYRWKRGFAGDSNVSVFVRRAPGTVEYLVIDATGAYAYYAAKNS